MTLWCKNSCGFGSVLSFPVSFSSNLKTENLIGVPGTSIKECVHPNRWRDEHTHTHAHFIPSKKDFWYIKVRRYNIFNLSLFYIIFCKQKYVSKLCLYCQFALFQVKLFFVTMVLDMEIQFNSIIFCSILFYPILYVSKLFQYLNYFRSNFLYPPWS